MNYEDFTVKLNSLKNELGKKLNMQVDGALHYSNIKK